MMDEKKKYRVSVETDYPEWWRYNVYINISGYDNADNISAFGSVEDKVYDIDAFNRERQKPQSYPPNRIISAGVDGCSYIKLFIYVVANTFPVTGNVSECSDFSITVNVYRNEDCIESKQYTVNQWGGMTIPGYEAGKEGA